MVIGNRLIRNIFIFFGVFVLFLNLLYVLELQGVNESYGASYTQTRAYFKGFAWFFNKLETFPGITPMTDFFNNMESYLSTTDLDAFFSIDNFIWLLKVITVPFMIVWKFLEMCVSNVAWIMSWVVPV